MAGQTNNVSLNEYRELSLKYEHAIKLASVDQRARQELVDELERAWRQANLAKSKEKSTLETVKSLKLEISNLSKLVEQGVGLTMGQEYNVREVLKEKEALLNENKLLKTEMNEMRVKMSEMERKELACVKILEDTQAELGQAVQETRAKELAIQSWTRKCERLEEELSNQKRIYDNKELALTRLNQSIEPLRAEKAKLETGLKEAQLSLEKTRKELEIVNARHIRLQNELDQLYLRQDTLQVENGQLVQQLKRGQELIEMHKIEHANSLKARDVFDRKLNVLELERDALIADKQTLRLQIESGDKKLIESNAKVEADKKRIDGLVSEKELLNIELRKAQFELEKKLVELKTLKTEVGSLRNEITKLNITTGKSANQANRHEREKAKLVESVNNLTAKLRQIGHAYRIKSLHLERLGKELAVRDRNLANLESMVNLAKVEKNRLRNENLCLAEEARVLKEMIGKLENSGPETVKLLKEKDDKLELAAKAIDSDKKKLIELNSKVEKSELAVKELRSQLSLRDKDEQKLLEEIKILNFKFKNLEKVINAYEIVRNVFGTQLVRRNDEIALLYEKIRLLEGVLANGRQAYDLCLTKLQKTQLELASVKTGINRLTLEQKTAQGFKRALACSERELALERAKLGAMESGEQTRILNKVHKWRDMSLCEPATYQLVSKIAMLQKRLIAKSEQAAYLRVKFMEKDRLFIELKQILARRLVGEEQLVERMLLIKSNGDSIKKNKALLAENKMLGNELEKLTKKNK